MTRNTKINLTYSMALLFGLIVMAVGFVFCWSMWGVIVSSIVYPAISIIGGIIALHKKRRLRNTWAIVMLILSPIFYFPIVVLCLKPRVKKRVIRRAPAPVEAANV